MRGGVWKMPKGVGYSSRKSKSGAGERRVGKKNVVKKGEVRK